MCDSVMSVAERLKLYGALATYKAIAESLESPANFEHEEIFSWSPSVLKKFLRDLLANMDDGERAEALDVLDPDSFDFVSVVPARSKGSARVAMWC